jgi:acyl-CoA thioester hydrolase
VNQQRVQQPALLDLSARASFNHWIQVALRYSDLDPIGHVNNAITPMFFEEARCQIIYPVLRAQGRTDLDLVLVRTVIDYARELSYPGAVDVGMRIHRVGNKSIHMVHGVFDANSGKCTATGECVCVVFDQKNRASITPPEDVRMSLEAMK